MDACDKITCRECLKRLKCFAKEEADVNRVLLPQLFSWRCGENPVKTKTGGVLEFSAQEKHFPDTEAFPDNMRGRES